MKAKLLKTLKWAGILVLALALLYAIATVWTSHVLSQAYARLASDGRPMTAEAIIPPAVPDADNAALNFDAAILLLKSAPPWQPAAGEDLADTAKAPNPGNLSLGQRLARPESYYEQLNDAACEFYSPMISPRDFKEPEAFAQAQAERRREAVRLFRELAARPVFAEAMAAWERGTAKSDCRREINYRAGTGMTLPHLVTSRGMSRIVNVTAVTKAQDGDLDDAWRLVEAHVRYADMLRDEPVLVSQVMRVAQLAIAEQTIHEVAALGLPTPGQQARIDAALRRFDDPAPLVRAMDGDRLTIGEWAWNLPFSMKAYEMMDGEGTKLTMNVLLVAVLRPLRQLDHATYLDLLGEYARASAKPFSPLDGRYDEQILKIPRYCILTRLLVPSLGQCKVKFTVMMARARIARAGLAVLAYRQQHGNWPETLAATGESYQDPFSGKELVYQPAADGFLIYSLGPRPGRLWQQDRSSATPDDGDLIWRYDALAPAS